MASAFERHRWATWVSLWLLAVTAAYGAAPPDRVEAVVNKQVITTRDVAARTGGSIVKYRQTYEGREPVDQIKHIEREALHRLIEEKLLLAEAEKLIGKSKLMKKVIEDKVKARMQEIVRKAGGELQARDIIRKQSGLSFDEFRQKKREEVMRLFVLEWHGILPQRHVRDNVVVSPREIREYYHSRREEFGQEPQAEYRQILLYFQQHGTRERTRAFARVLLGKLRKGQPFGRLAKIYSDGAYADGGGRWGFTPQSVLREELAKALFGLEPGQVSSPIETQTGLYLLKCQEILPEDQIRFRQILLLFKKHDTREKTHALAWELMAKLKKGAAFEKLAKEHSDGPHADRGGLWGPVRRGALAQKEVDRGLFGLKPGEVSAFVETDAGIYILKCGEVLPGRPLTLEEAQPLIREQLVHARLQARYQKLVERLYMKNYVRIRGVQTMTPPHVSALTERR